MERRRQWAARGVHELQMSLDTAYSQFPTPSACFITLTYSDDNLPENGNLRKEDWQNFAKRLRNQWGSFRFIMCGEYGETRTERCHFHAIIYGQTFPDAIHSDTTPNGQKLFISPSLDKIWGKGLHAIGSVSFDSISYCCGYINKKARHEHKRRHYQRLNKKTGELYDQVPEFGLQSRNKGIGNSWIEKFHTDVYPSDEIIMGGYKQQPPAYYDRWYEKAFPEKWEPIKEKRALKAIEWAKTMTPERLKTREKIFKSRNKIRDNEKKWNTYSMPSSKD